MGSRGVGQVQEQDKEELIEDLRWRGNLGREVTRREKWKSEDAAMSRMSSLPLSTLERKEMLCF